MPATVTSVALVAVTVNVDELPAAIVAGLAVIVTVGAEPATPTVTVTLAEPFPPAPLPVAV
jgi:hypothetical protein